MEIEVISDGPYTPIHDDIETVVRSIGGDRVSFYRHPVRAGQPEIFNVCVRRAKGRWIHILHDDDWIGPCFYQTLYEGVKNAPAAGAAFCRHRHVDDSGKRIRDSSLERETPGVL